MARKAWTYTEIKFLIENYDLTTDELRKELPRRSRKSIERKLEKLRDEERIGLRSKNTVLRAYAQRGQSKAENVEPLNEDNEVWEEDDYEVVEENDDWEEI